MAVFDKFGDETDIEMAYWSSENTLHRLGPYQFLTVENYEFSGISFPMAALDIILAAKPK